MPDADEDTLEDRRARLVRYIKNHSYFVTALQCAEAYGCTQGNVHRVIKDLKRMKRLSRRWKPIPGQARSALVRHWNLIPQIVSFEHQSMPLDEVVFRLNISIEDLRLVRASLTRYQHKGFLDARKSRRKWRSKPKEPTVSREEQARRDAEIETANCFNAVSYYADDLLEMLDGKKLYDLDLNKGEITSLTRYDLIHRSRGHNAEVTEKAKRILAEIGRLG